MTFTLQIVVTAAAQLFACFAAGFVTAAIWPPTPDNAAGIRHGIPPAHAAFRLFISAVVEAVAIVIAGVATGLPPLAILGWTATVVVHLVINLRRL